MNQTFYQTSLGYIKLHNDGFSDVIINDKCEVQSNLTYPDLLVWNTLLRIKKCIKSTQTIPNSEDIFDDIHATVST